MTHEIAYWAEFHGLYSIFLTLTYDDAHLPMYGVLVKEDIQNFMKRLWWKVGTEKLRYYVVGEYGSQCPYHEIVDCPKCGPIQRPHYHAIIFGWAAPPSDQEILGHRDGMVIYKSQIIEDAWKQAGDNGKEIIGSHEYSYATFEACAYVARYIMKKVTGDEHKVADHYCKHIWQTDTWIDMPPEFAMMSKRPGIGKLYLDEYMHDIYPADEACVPGRTNVSKPPKYYDQFYEAKNPTDMERIKQARRKAMAESLVNGPSLKSRAIVEDYRLNMYHRS